MYKLINLIETWFKLRKPTLEGDRYTIKNPLEVLMKKNGTVKLSNGFEIPFTPENKQDILNVVAFALLNGIRFGDKEYQWKLNLKDGVIETHQGIKFKINSIGLLDETFLSQIHFSGFDLKDKVVVTAGAYIGDTPLFYSYYGAKVYAFEPDPNSYQKAKYNISINPNLQDRIKLMNYAIGEDGEISFPIESDSAGSSIYKLEGKRVVKVRSVSVSTILNEFKITNPFLLDLDIKGAEFTVIEDESISRFKRIRIEYSPYLLKDKSKSLAYLIQKLKGYGFNNVRIYKHNNIRFDLMTHGTVEAEK
jgi:FkbM family methyltransferase